MNYSANRKVLVSGASIAGPTLAYWLDRYGFEVTVVEKASAVRGGGYATDIRSVNPNAISGGADGLDLEVRREGQA